MFFFATNIALLLLVIPPMGALYTLVFYFKTMRQLQRPVADVYAHAQVAAHVAARMQNNFLDVYNTAMLPGCISPDKENDQLLQTIAGVIFESGSEHVPIDLLIQVHHQTRLGALLDFAICFLYTCDSNMLGHGLVWCWQLVPLATFFATGMIRAHRCVAVFGRLGALLASLGNLAHQCRFRMDLRGTGVKFADRMVPLARTSDAEWQFHTAQDRNRFMHVFANHSTKTMFERINRPNQDTGVQVLSAALREQQAAERSTIFQPLTELLSALRPTFVVWLSAVGAYPLLFAQVLRKESFASNIAFFLRGPRNVAKLVLANSMLVKIFLCALTAFVTNSSGVDVLSLAASTATVFLRLEILLLAIKIAIAAFCAPVWLCSSLANTLQGFIAAQSSTQEKTVRAINAAVATKPVASVDENVRPTIDAILVE
jgi:hypothetical protein